MNTPTVRSLVSSRSYMIALATMAALAACAPAVRPAVWDADEVAAARPVAIRFENEASQEVDVYLVGARRQWRLGRIAPGGSAKLAIPEEAIVDADGFVRLAVIEGGSVTVDAARDPRTRFSIAQPIADLPTQRFAFRERQAGGAQVVGMR